MGNNKFIPFILVGIPIAIMCACISKILYDLQFPDAPMVIGVAFGLEIAGFVSGIVVCVLGTIGYYGSDSDV
jgi:hypothetical protein